MNTPMHTDEAALPEPPHAPAPPADTEPMEVAMARQDSVLALADPVQDTPDAHASVVEDEVCAPEPAQPEAPSADETTPLVDIPPAHALPDHVPAQAQADPAGSVPADPEMDEPTTLVMAQPDDEPDEPTVFLPSDPDERDEPTTLVAAQPVHEDEEPTTLVLAEAHEADEATTLVAASGDYDDEEATTLVQAGPDEPSAAPAAPERQAASRTPPTAAPGHPPEDLDDEGVTELQITPIGADAAHGAPTWFNESLQHFTQALRQNEQGAPRPPHEVQQLALAARDLIARVAMQGGARPAADGWTGDSVLQPDQLLANTYVVRSLIARGGVGEIYRTRHRDLRTEHAVKVLLPRYALDPTVLTLMLDEARLLACVRHEAVVRCQDLLRDADGRPMLVMDYLRGQTLSLRLRQGRLATPELVVLTRRLAEGLGAIHAAGIVHQDVSPDNVMLADDSCGAATIIDFGLARRMGTGRDMHRNLDFAGKYSWSSPEQLSGRPAAVDARSDLYSLGLMLAAAARGYRLDMGQDLESARAARTTVPSLAGIEQPMAGLIEALLAPSPDARLGTAAEVIAMLTPKPPSLWQRIGAYFGIKEDSANA